MKKVGICENFNIDSYSYHLIDSIKQYKEYGYWFEKYIDYISLENIEYKLRDPNRYHRNMELIKNNNDVLPIELYNDDPLSDKKIYNVTDGNHICCVCSDLGYTHMPAILEKKSYIKPCDDKIYDFYMKLLIIDEIVDEYTESNGFNISATKFDHTGYDFIIDRYSDHIIISDHMMELEQKILEKHNFRIDWSITSSNDTILVSISNTIVENIIRQ
jgi:hypothetical protein